MSPPSLHVLLHHMAIKEVQPSHGDRFCPTILAVRWHVGNRSPVRGITGAMIEMNHSHRIHVCYIWWHGSHQYTPFMLAYMGLFLAELAELWNCKIPVGVPFDIQRNHPCPIELVEEKIYGNKTTMRTLRPPRRGWFSWTQKMLWWKITRIPWENHLQRAGAYLNV